jgi:hypothetical protein
MFYIKSWSLYRREKGANNVYSYPITPITTFSCKVEPVSDLAGTGLEWAGVFDIFKIYTDYTDIKTGDKIIIDTITYIVKGKKKRQWLLRSFTPIYAQISNGD